MFTIRYLYACYLFSKQHFTNIYIVKGIISLTKNLEHHLWSINAVFSIKKNDLVFSLDVNFLVKI